MTLPTVANSTAAPCGTTTSTITIVVGSANKAKIQSVQFAAERLFADMGKTVQVRGMAVHSQVAAQPMTDQETMEGAVHRAKHALREDPEASFAVGLEGGVQKIGNAWFESMWADHGGPMPGMLIIRLSSSFLSLCCVCVCVCPLMRSHVLLPPVHADSPDPANLR